MVHASIVIIADRINENNCHSLNVMNDSQNLKLDSKAEKQFILI